jgi:hydrogenase nickel incorporation protein HypA/HybF
VHELGITQEVVDAVTRRLPEAKVTCVRLEVGALSGIVADSVRFCFELVTPGHQPGGRDAGDQRAARALPLPRLRRRVRARRPAAARRCGSADVDVLLGRDLRIISVEFAS